MSHANLAQQLHDKVTRGRALSAAEQAQLDSWYAQQDQEESASLAVTSPPQSLEELHLLARYRDVVTLLEHVHRQQAVLLTEHRALLRRATGGPQVVAQEQGMKRCIQGQEPLPGHEGYCCKTSSPHVRPRLKPRAQQNQAW